MQEQPRKLRADAARNRDRVLAVAYEVFAAEGLAVPIDEIARRAGVGAGTVYRHFPTKEALFRAIVDDRLQRLVDQAQSLAADREPGEALFGFLAAVVEEGAADHGLVDALAGIGFDIATEAPGAEDRFMSALADLLTRAQQAHAVRADIGVRDLKALLVGCQAMQQYTRDPQATERILAVVRDGLSVGRKPGAMTACAPTNEISRSPITRPGARRFSSRLRGRPATDAWTVRAEDPAAKHAAAGGSGAFQPERTSRLASPLIPGPDGRWRTRRRSAGLVRCAVAVRRPPSRARSIRACG